MGLLYLLIRFNSVVVMGSILSTGGVQSHLYLWWFISISSRVAPLYHVQWVPLKLWWRTSIEVRGCFTSGWGVGGSMGVALSNYGARSSSLILVGFLLSSCEGLHSTYFRELISICDRSTSL